MKIASGCLKYYPSYFNCKEWKCKLMKKMIINAIKEQVDIFRTVGKFPIPWLNFWDAVDTYICWAADVIPFGGHNNLYGPSSLGLF